MKQGVSRRPWIGWESGQRNGSVAKYAVMHFGGKNRDVMLRVSKALVRPYLVYCKPFWAPYLRRDGVAWRVQRMIQG